MTQAQVRNWQIVSSIADVQALEVEWQRLFRSNPSHSPFQAWGWTVAWIRHLASSPELKIICGLDENGVLCYILPLVAGPRQVFFEQCTYYVTGGYGPDCSDYIGPLRSPALESEVAAVTTEAIRTCVDPACRIVLPALDASDNFPVRASSGIKGSGRIVRLLNDNVCPAVRLPESWDEYLGGLSSNFRSQVRRHCRKMRKLSGISIQRIEPPEASRFAAELIRLNRTRISHKGSESSLEDEKFRNFIADAIPALVNEELAWMDAVTDGEKYLAAAFNMVYAGRVYYYMGGFDETASQLRPGTVLFAEAIQRSIENGMKSYDFLRGAESYKYRWGGADVPTWKLTVYPDRLIRGRAALAADRFKSSLLDAALRLREKAHRNQK